MAPTTATTPSPTATGAITLVTRACVSCCVEELLLKEAGVLKSAGEVLLKSLDLCVVVGGERLEVEGKIFVVRGAEEDTGDELGVFEDVCGSAEVSKGAPDVRCGGDIVETGCVSALTEEEPADVGVKSEVGKGVLVLSVVVLSVVVCRAFSVVVCKDFSVVVCRGFSGSSMHSSVQAVHCPSVLHLMRLEVPALLTNPSMQL